MKQIELKQAIMNLGFQHFTPACATWGDAFIFQFEDKVLAILTRSKGVDLRYYSEFNNQIFLNQNNTVSLNEGTIVRYGYGQVRINIHDHALKVATDFTCKKIDSSIDPTFALQGFAM